ncbi:MAG: hypothetical protein ABJ249_18485, partial [Lentilitoribacter sp.]
ISGFDIFAIFTKTNARLGRAVEAKVVTQDNDRDAVLQFGTEWYKIRFRELCTYRSTIMVRM